MAHSLDAWRTLPDDVPLNIVSETDLLSLTPYVAPVLSGGFGNILYEIAAGCVLAKRLGVPCVIAWWDQDKPGLDREFMPYDGRGDPAPGISIKHIFPMLLYADFQPATRYVTEDNNATCFYFRGSE
jgi:hypothetical protein